MRPGSTNIRKLDTEDQLHLTRPKYGLGIAWDSGRTKVDLDLQAVVVNKKGTIVDAVYYNNLSAMHGAVAHSGDEQTGDAPGDDEMIWVNTRKLPNDISMIIFVVGAYSGGHLKDLTEGMVNIVEENCWNKVARFSMACGRGDVEPLCTMRKMKDGAWVLRPIEQSIPERGQHFMDILEPTLGDLIREHIRGAPKLQEVHFEMVKGGTVDMPRKTLQKVSVAVGWDVARTTGRSIDVDISAVFFHKDGRDLGGVWFENPEENGLRHTGDNVNGVGDGDDEVIEVDLERIPEQVHQIMFVVNIYSKATTMNCLENAFCRVIDNHKQDIVHYKLDQCKTPMSGLIISRFLRDTGSRWCFQALGVFCNGRSWMSPSCMEDLKAISKIPPAKLQKKIENLNTLHNEQQKRPQLARSNTLFGGSVVILPEDHIHNTISVALGWDIIKPCRRTADLDVSTLCFQHDGRHVGSVYWDNMEDFGIKHTGDAVTGTGDGDDEVIYVDLLAIPENIASIFFVVHVYTKSLNFGAVNNAYLRISAASGKELVRFAITENKPHRTGLIMAELFRKSDSMWGFQAHGTFCNGRSCIDNECMSAIQRILFTKAVRQAGKAIEMNHTNKHEKHHGKEQAEIVDIPINLSHVELSDAEEELDDKESPETDSDTSTKTPTTPRRGRVIVSL